MTRAVLTAAISLMISCHSPSMAPRVTDDPLTTGSAPAEPAALEHAEPPPPDPAAPIVPENLGPIGDTLAGLRFGVGMRTNLVIPAGELPAGGQAKARLTLRMRVRVAP